MLIQVPTWLGIGLKGGYSQSQPLQPYVIKQCSCATVNPWHSCALCQGLMAPLRFASFIGL